MLKRLREELEARWERLHLRLSGFENPPDRLLLALLRTVCGLLTGALILAWHGVITLAHSGIVGSLATRGFETLPLAWRVTLPVGGALLLRATDLVRYLKETEVADGIQPERIDLTHIPGQRLEVRPIHLRATLRETFDNTRDDGAEALIVTRTTRHGRTRILGILTRSEIENAYRI